MIMLKWSERESNSLGGWSSHRFHLATLRAPHDKSPDERLHHFSLGLLLLLLKPTRLLLQRQ